MSFMVFPPELNSSLMYSGAGSGPLMAAASAWDELAADLETTAASYQTIVGQLTGSTWLGPSSMRMAAAAAPFVAWLEGSSAQAALTSGQARLAAAAYESAFAATVPPAMIAANRSLLMALIATNFLGQNTPAIAATEAQYMEMWFQDGLTMDTYATLSQQAVVLPQQTPAPNTSDGGTSANAAAAAQSTANSSSTLSTDLQALLQAYWSEYTSTGGSTNPLTAPWTSVLTDVGVPTSWDSTLLNVLAPAAADSTEGALLPIQGTYYAAMFASMPAKMLISLGNTMTASQAAQASNQAFLGTISQLVDSKLSTGLGSLGGQLRGFGQAISAQLASAHRLGGLSIPNGWAQQAPEMAVRAAPVLPANSISPAAPAANLPNSPFTQALMGALNGRGMGTQAAKTAPVKVETRSPAGG
jgi:PPE-repeat protein